MGRLKDLKKLFFGGPEARQYNTDSEDEKAGTEEQAAAVPYTNRHSWGDFSLLQRLTPDRLSEILNDVKHGECPAEYLELTQDIELKDLHYRSILSTRKDAVTGLEIKVIPAGEDKHDVELADAVERDIVKNGSAKLYTLIRDMPDALAKGFSVSEQQPLKNGKMRSILQDLFENQPGY
jgi:phage gp29-like protein